VTAAFRCTPAACFFHTNAVFCSSSFMSQSQGLPPSNVGRRKTAGSRKGEPKANPEAAAAFAQLVLWGDLYAAKRLRMPDGSEVAPTGEWFLGWIGKALQASAVSHALRIAHVLCSSF
jgi:hypothetical protein